MSSCKSVTTPLAAHFKLSSKTCSTSVVKIKKMSHVPYTSAVGNLMYAMVYTRLDLAYAVSTASCCMHNPVKDH